jgi:hypothetical protein
MFSLSYVRSFYLCHWEGHVIFTIGKAKKHFFKPLNKKNVNLQFMTIQLQKNSKIVSGCKKSISAKTLAIKKAFSPNVEFCEDLHFYIHAGWFYITVQFVSQFQSRLKIWQDIGIKQISLSPSFEDFPCLKHQLEMLKKEKCKRVSFYHIS